MGKLKKFKIMFSNRKAVYHAGEVLRGHIHVELSAPMKMTFIRMQFHGRAKVCWKKSTGDSYITYRANEVYFDRRFTVLHGSAQDPKELSTGVHRFPFSYIMPRNLPSSFEGSYGFVRYECIATIERPWKFDHVVKSAFTVLRPLDLNKEGTSIRMSCMGKMVSDVSCLCYANGRVEAMLRINKQAYVPGENIIINARVRNGTNITMGRSKVVLKQYCEYYGRSDAMFTSGQLKPTIESQVIAQLDRPEMGHGETTVWEEVKMRIPPAPPSKLTGCSIINISYAVKLHVDVKYGVDIKISKDIVLGTVPLRQLDCVHHPIVQQPSRASAQTTPDRSLPSPPPEFENIPLVVALPPYEEAQTDGLPESPPPPYEYDGPPPSYEEYEQGRVTLREEGDSEYMLGDLEWAPSYPCYRLSPSPSRPPPPFEENSL